ncbi:MAG TPA: prolyl aminopeptidase [Pyrinomonadaceae bacterium]|jgi:proline iminopeptidase|nr:prolyl aminopeptidase [Pyrinomonadaceae bacterium]
MKTFYPPLEPYDQGFLEVSPVHNLYYEQSGNPAGKPVVFLHGGPGGGTIPLYRQFFDPEAYRIVLFDQRGSGRSTPHANLEENTTWDLVADIEKLRAHLGVERWVVFGGSWGSTLALAYAQTHPERARALVLRGIFLCRRKEINWFYQEGASAIFPDVWEEYVKVIPEGERGDLLSAYHRRLTSADENERLTAARAWSVWEGSTSKLFPDQQLIDHFGEPQMALALARIECHYFVNNSFLATDNYLVENVGKIRHIPAVIVQGRYDVVCPMMSAWELHRAWPEADFRVVPDAGHSATEPGIVNELITATDLFAAGD